MEVQTTIPDKSAPSLFNLIDETPTAGDLSEKQATIARFKSIGCSNSEIAKATGIPIGTVSVYAANPLVRKYMKEIQASVHERIETAITVMETAVIEAAKLKVETLRGEVDGAVVPLATRLKQADDILNMTGAVAKRESPGGLSLNGVIGLVSIPQNNTINVPAREIPNDDVPPANPRS